MLEVGLVSAWKKESFHSSEDLTKDSGYAALISFLRTLLVDAIRDPQATWSSAASALKADPRFSHSPLPAAHRQALFAAHIDHLRAKQITALHALFEAHAPGLNVLFQDLSRETLQSLVTSFPVQKLGLGTATPRDRTRSMSRRQPKRPRNSVSPPPSSDEDSYPAYDYYDLEREFAGWQSDRYSIAREAFDAMLKENSFVKFWGRVGKMGVVEDEEKARLGKVVFGDEQGDAGADEMEEGEGGGGKADLKSLAKGIDVKEMERVLRVSNGRFKKWPGLTLTNYLARQAIHGVRLYARGKGIMAAGMRPLCTTED